jgi:mannose/cellobiose epimerase-like protein (N-acyl-D-glucosamine 2-epimerase family)
MALKSKPHTRRRPPPNWPDFEDPAFLRAHIEHTLGFYHPRCIDPHGGFFHHFRDDGSIADRLHRHLVSSARFVFNYAMPVIHFGTARYRDQVLHGLGFLHDVHRNPATGGYVWELRGRRVLDDTNHAYGLAFVLLAHAVALRAGIDEAETGLRQTFDLLEEHFWQPDAGAYRDELSADWRQDSGYRGQNSNMHLCEAMIAAHAATGEGHWLDRADQLADAVARRLAAQAGGRIWEHYDRSWRIDWDYNRDNPRHMFRPWGFQTGHQTEWTKLLLQLEALRPSDWRRQRAQALFDDAVAHGWHDADGLVYGYDPEGRICDADKYFWVQAETLVAAARLFTITGDERYREWYHRIWRYAWTWFVDHEHGAWYRILTPDNRRYDDLKSPAGKTDYHTMGACYELIEIFTAGRSRPASSR